MSRLDNTKEYLKKNRNNVIYVTLIIIASVFLVTRLSIVPPPPPEEGVGYAKIKLFDPIGEFYVEGKIDLVTVDNITKYYMRGVDTDTVVYLTEPCYIVFNGTVTSTYPRDYYSFSGAVEANEKQTEARVNTFTVYRKSEPSEVDLQIFKLNNTYGDFNVGDVSNIYNTTMKIQISNANTSNRIGYYCWLPEMELNQTTIDLNETGHALWLGFVGSCGFPPLESDWITIDGFNNTVYEICGVSIIKIALDHTDEYEQEIFIPQLNSVSEVILYNQEISNWYDEQLATI